MVSVRSLGQFFRRVSDAIRFGQAPTQGILVKADPTLDGVQQYLVEGINFEKLKGLIHSGDAGDYATTINLFSQMEYSDPHLASVANTRRIALTKLDWEVTSAAADQRSGLDTKLADDAAAFVRETLANLGSLAPALEHLSTAIGRGLAVVEIVWSGDELERLVPVGPDRLTGPPWGCSSPSVYVVTREQRSGVPASPGKFICHIPYSPAERPLECALSRSQATAWLIKKLAVRDWALFCQTFGMPVRWATYRGNASTEEKTELQKMLAGMGTNGWALFSEAVQFTMVESTDRGVSPYQTMIEYCEKSQSKLMLGGHLMVDTANATGTHAAGAVQEQVREDLRDDDIARESRTISEQLIAPLCAYAYPGRHVALPKFRRKKPEIIDRQLEAQVINSALSAGLQVPRDWAHRALAIPEPELRSDGTPAKPVLSRSNPFAEEGL